MLTNEQIKEIVERVYEWNRVAGNTGKFDTLLENNLFNEEFGEFDIARQNADKLEMLDGFIDMFIVLVGSMYKRGVSVNVCVNKMNEYVLIGGGENKQRSLNIAFKSIYPFTLNLYEAFIHILDSNDSKFIKDKKGELVAIKNEAGKIMKGPNYFKPDLSPFIKNTND